MRPTVLVVAVFVSCESGKDTATGLHGLSVHTSTTTESPDADHDGFSVADGDCDDDDPAVNPAATEVCADLVDNDCDPFTADCDCDGDGIEGMACGGADCDDEADFVYPGAPDACYDGIDADCAGGDDHDCDGDGDPAPSGGGGDCADDDPTIHSGTPEVCYDGLDNDCSDATPDCDCDADGYDDVACGGTDCDDADPHRHPSAEDVCYDGLDADCAEDDDYDCDGDGEHSMDYGGSDCDDTDPTINSGGTEVCWDGIDNDCNVFTVDCDCDVDWVIAAECGGDDCDDTDPTVYPGASEDVIDGRDDDCDGLVDEDAYCNELFPMGNGKGATRVYDTVGWDGVTYVETMTVADWDPATGEGLLAREFAAGLDSFEITEWIRCTGAVEIHGLSSTHYYLPGDAAYTSPRVFLLEQADMVVGATWAYAYDVEVASTGLPLWRAEGSYTVVGQAVLTTPAGTFEVLEILNDYAILDPYYGLFDRSGVITHWYAPRIGLVESIETNDLGDVLETRQLVSYLGYFP